MKLFIFVFLLFIFNHAYAMDPVAPCDYNSNCSEQQKNIIDKFEQTNEFSKEHFSNKVYSGACYYSNKNYRNTQAHYAYIYFDWVEKQPRFVGAFNFYANPNPYAKLTPQDVLRQKEDALQQPKRTLNLKNDDFAYVYFPADEPRNDIHYWFKTSNDKLFLYGYWSYNYKFACELETNK